MSSQLENALLHMSLDEEDEPFVLPDHSEYYSTGRNSLSLVERLMDPRCQKMLDLIHDMLQKWQLYDRDWFQFIFKHEHDFLGVLNRGVHMWPIVMERWVEELPVDYLQYIFVWVQLRNISINHYTCKALSALGRFRKTCSVSCLRRKSSDQRLCKDTCEIWCLKTSEEI